MHAPSGGGSQEPQGLTPIPGILDAPNVVILGASLMDSAFGSAQTLNAPMAEYAVAAGFTGTLHVRSQSGDSILHTIAKHVAAAAEPALSATEGQNLYVVHTGGNDVSSQRPWPGGQPAFQSNYDTLMQQITATDRVVPLPLTKRLYTTAPEVVDGDLASEENGSKPYNENIIYPAIQSAAPDWRNAPGTPFVNPYELADRYPQLLSSDGVHGYGASLGRYILARLAGRALGKAAGQSRAGSSVLYSITSGEPNTMSIGPMNVFRSYPSGFLNQPLLCGAVATDGAFDPFIEVLRAGVFQNASSNAGTGTFARIPDPRFHIPDLVNNGIYVQGTQVFTLEFAQLTPGDTVTLTAVGVRNATGTNRRGLLTLSTGQSLELDGSNVAPSNMAVFDPVTVPADGRLTLDLSVAPGSTYGYLHGIMLDFS
jgi:hypothetical protein